MSARFCVLAAVMAVGLASAFTPFTDGCTAATGNNALYVNVSTGCAAVITCNSKYTSCLGSTKNCTLAGQCIADFLSCVNTAADSTGCTSLLANLKLALLSVTNGALYNSSNAYKSCVASSCSLLNTTYNGAGTNCSLDISALCVSPVNFVATLLLQGQFSTILADPVKRAKFAAALLEDLFRILRIVGIALNKMFIQGSKRQALQTLVVEVKVPGVSAQNTAFSAAFTNLKNSGSSWATSAGAVYAAETGGTLKVLGVAAGGSSSAFSVIPVATNAPATSAPSNTTKAPTTAAPATPTPNATTKSPGTAAPSNTTKTPTANTPAPPTPATTKAPTTKAPTTGSESSGASARSLLVAAAIAVLSAAFLF